MRSDCQYREGRVASLQPADQIGALVEMYLETRLLEALSQPPTTIEKSRREASARIGQVRVGDFPQRHEIAPETSII